MSLSSYQINNGGYLELITGCMWSGKSSMLIQKMERHNIAGRSTVVIKWKGDTRYGKDAYVYSHGGNKLPCIMCDDESLKTVYQDYSLEQYDVIGIEEGSFFKDIAAFADNLANRGHMVYVASLVGTWDRKGFGDILNLIPKCDNIVFLHAVCMSCGSDTASFSRRLLPIEKEQYVGGKETYQAVCRKCFKKP